MHRCGIPVPRNIPLKDLEEGSFNKESSTNHECSQITFVPHFDWSVDAPTTAYFLCVKKNFCFSAEVTMLDVDRWRRLSMTERMAGDRVIMLVKTNQKRCIQSPRPYYCIATVNSSCKLVGTLHIYLREYETSFFPVVDVAVTSLRRSGQVTCISARTNAKMYIVRVSTC
jgi:hypothetical protein